MKDLCYLFTIVFLILGCGSSSDYNWPIEQEKEYIRGCILGAKQVSISQSDAEKLLECNLKNIQQSYSDYNDLNTKETMEEVQRVAQDCAKQVGIK